MNTFTTSQGEAGKDPALPTASSNTTASPKNIDLNTVYMFLEELKLSFEKGQAKQSDGSQVQTEVYSPEVFENILLKAMSGIDFRFTNPIPDLSKLPKPKDYSQNFTDLGTKIEKKDSETAKALSTLGTTMTKLEAAVKSNTAAVNAGPKVQKVEKTIKFDINSWKCFACVVASFIISLFLGVWIIIQSHDMDKYTDTDLKYRFIQMNGSVSSVGLDSIEVWFQDPDRVSNIRKMVTEHEQRMEQLRRSTLERDRLNNEINELNSQNPPQQKMKEMKNLPISADAQKSIKAFFYDFCMYMEENYCASPNQLMLDWNSVGATARFIGNGHNIQYRLWERSNGYLGIPGMTLIVHVFSVADSMENVLALCKWTGEAAKANGFRHIADPDRQPEEADNQVTECQIACLTL